MNSKNPLFFVSLVLCFFALSLYFACKNKTSQPEVLKMVAAPPPSGMTHKFLIHKVKVTLDPSQSDPNAPIVAVLASNHTGIVHCQMYNNSANKAMITSGDSSKVFYFTAPEGTNQMLLRAPDIYMNSNDVIITGTYGCIPTVISDENGHILYVNGRMYYLQAIHPAGMQPNTILTVTTGYSVVSQAEYNALNTSYSNVPNMVGTIDACGTSKYVINFYDPAHLGTPIGSIPCK